MELKKDENFYRTIFEKSAVGESVVGLDGRWLEVNSRLCEITGYSKKELLSKNFADITHPEDIKRSNEARKNLASGKMDYITIEKKYIRKDKNIVWVLLSITLARDDSKKPEYFIVHTQDITTIKKTEQQLADLRNKYRAIIEKGNDGIVIIQDFLTKFANARMIELSGYGFKQCHF